MKYFFILLALGVFVMNPLFSHAENTNDFIESAVKGEYQKAITDAQKALTKLPDNLFARLVLSRLYLETGEYARAEALLEYFPALNSEAKAKLSPQSLLTLYQGTWLYATRKGDKYLFQKIVRDALPQIEKSTTEPALKEKLYLFWGNCYMEKGDLPAAAGCFSDTLTANPSSAEACLGLAKIYYASSDKKQALFYLNRALELSPAASNTASFLLPIASIRTESLNLLATGQLMNETTSDALGTINSALDINPNSVSYRATKASIYYFNNNLPDFEKECRRILEVNKYPALFYLIVGDNCERRLLYTEATAFYEKALAMDGHLWDARIAAGLNYMHLGPEYEKKGRQLLDEAFARDPFNVKVYNMLKVLDALRDDFETIKTENFEIKVHKNERFLLEPYITELLENSFDKFTDLYQYKPVTPLLVEVFPNHNDFSVRLMGFPGFLGARGVCFARTFLVLSPKAQEQMAARFHWGAITVHEFMHIITLQMSRFRVPRWFTEGCSVYAEKLYNPAWGEEVEEALAKALSENKLKRLPEFAYRRDADITHSYYLSSVIIEYIHEKYGMPIISRMLRLWGEGENTETVFQECLKKGLAEFDKEFFDYFNREFFRDINFREFEKTFNLARELYKRNQPNEAIEEFIRAKQYFPRYTKAGFSPYHYLITIYEEQNQTDKMYAEIEELTRINHLDFDNQMKLAKHYRSLEQYDKLTALLKNVVYLEPENIQLHNYLARGYHAQKQYAKALQEYGIAIRLLTSHMEGQTQNDLRNSNKVLADFYCAQAEVYLELNDKISARGKLLQAHGAYPGYKKISELSKRCE
jgi:tetratricopeptide (TPR) repeat protein